MAGDLDNHLFFGREVFGEGVGVKYSIFFRTSD